MNNVPVVWTTYLFIFYFSRIYLSVCNTSKWMTLDKFVSVLAIWIPEPTYNGPSNVVYFRTAVSLEDELARSRNMMWLICFYTAWNPSCANFAPVFAQLSAEYVCLCKVLLLFHVSSCFEINWFFVFQVRIGQFQIW